MERRMLLAVVLSFVAVTAYSMLMQGMRPPQEAPTENGAGEEPGVPGPGPDGTDPKDPAPANGNGNSPAPAPGPGEDPAPDPGEDPSPDPGQPAPKDPLVEHPHASVPETSVKLTSESMEVTFSSIGASVSNVRLRNQFGIDKETPLDLVVPFDPLMSFGSADDTRTDPENMPGTADRRNLPAGALRRFNWKRDQAAEAKTPDVNDVVYTFTDKGRRWMKRWIMPKGATHYDLTLEISLLDPSAAKDAGGRPLKLLTSSGHLSESRIGMDMFGAAKPVAMQSPAGDDPVQDEHGFGTVRLEPGRLESPALLLLGTRSLYFTVGFFNANGAKGPPVLRYWSTGEDATQREQMEKRLVSFFEDQRDKKVTGSGEDTRLKARIVAGVNNMLHTWMVLSMPTDGTPVRVPLYAGPMARDTLAQDGYEPLESMITFSMSPDWIAKALLAIYDIFRGLFSSAGVAVILMTLLVRGLMMPLSIRNQLSMRTYSRKIQKVKPKLTALQAKYGKNPKKMREEQMKLYRENGIGFPGGCLMMLIQIPIWFALFAALRQEYTLRGQSFLWAADLSGPDTLIDFGFCIDLMVTQICGLNLLPILMVTLSIIHTRNMPKPQDEQSAQQYKMMKWMPIIFAVILYNYTAALLIYMVISSAFGILEAKIVRAKDDAAKNAEPAAA